MAAPRPAQKARSDHQDGDAAIKLLTGRANVVEEEPAHTVQHSQLR